ncbi:DNA gyrase subunit A [Caldicellulosiruptor bescii]|uniref:DNA gyrase subunit A n=2 Tax=Caldicellulosiruptor bescii TaxID=31899 RepID=B9ML43_CALBD|nr:DNA gyrase subunit A [Caldicellulosiruptor bescii]ACM59174.1 DNA gyrase, A subunit [Caldicellulosiruptor bescii DSM 6725]PBC88373.1 DNA gyrase subunit A [Caldicellulosiruptor bescii]PBC92146.1 DNA gyrase subunit A [Caldicellulosiruptor bescii]PBD05044.1 DNA gyrase subunit A [Caldicellulosiruptor bescii]PBD05325.1 DNA gyrase subunit A [Caldicellulosiruptor bescii]
MEELDFRIIPVEIQEEMKRSYIDYAMSVIVSRALPDVRDGLKPVHRRILYAMNEIGLTPDKPYRKSATVVGHVLAKYHPHGDAAVYESLVRMAQDFSMRHPLVDGHGNFGSVDGDPPAAMRYTEARMSKIALEMLRDIEKETVDFMPNFDESAKEPKVLPSRFPNLLVNGSQGIAVGMATNIPPHNLAEVIDAIVYLLDNENASLDDIMKIIKGPDFPTGGYIIGKKGIRDAYATGKGKIIVRAKATIEQTSKGRQRLVVTELPYMVNKARLIEKIAELVHEKRIDGISDIRDESDKEGLRIVIEIKKDADANVVLKQLYKNTQLQDSFGIIMLALVDNQPKVLTLMDMLNLYIEHQKEVIVRRTKYDLKKAEERAHILEGLKKALDHIDEIISIIRSSRTVNEAKERLISRFQFTEVQAQAILDMRLQRLTGLERQKIEEELAELIRMIEYYKNVLASDAMVKEIIKKEILEIKEKYKDERRTKIIQDEHEDFEEEELIQEQETVITLTHFGYIKRLPLDTYKSQKRGGRGITGISTREEDFVEDVFVTTTHHYILFFTDKGRVFRLRAYEVPEGSRQAKGTAIVNLIQIGKDEKITATMAVKDFKEGYLMMCTKNGTIKKVLLSEFENTGKSGKKAITLADDDSLVDVKLTSGNDEIVLVSSNGYCVVFNENDVRSMGRSAQGVKGMTLEDGDFIVGMEKASDGKYLLCVTENGFGKRSEIEEYRKTKRGAKGVLTYKVTEKTGRIVDIKMVNDEDEIMLCSTEGIFIRLEVSQIPVQGRNTQGVKLMRIDGDNIKVSSIARIRVDE